MQTDLAVAAARLFDEAAHGVIPLPGALAFGGVLQLLDEVGQQADVALLPQQDAVGWFPSRPARPAS